MLKLIKFTNNSSLKSLQILLDKRKSIQKKKTLAISKINLNVKKKGDKTNKKNKKKFLKKKKK